jgi:hypothetical protein
MKYSIQKWAVALLLAVNSLSSLAYAVDPCTADREALLSVAEQYTKLNFIAEYEQNAAAQLVFEGPDRNAFYDMSTHWVQDGENYYIHYLSTWRSAEKKMVTSALFKCDSQTGQYIREPVSYLFN